MGISCSFGFHAWDGCKCSKCGKIREEEHAFRNGELICAKCGKAAGASDVR